MRALLRRTSKLLAILGILVLLLAALAGGALWLSLPRGSQTVRLPGLSAPVDVTFDTDGIPRIRAVTERDAVTALGFVHARDRMFQMEMMRRAASGRLSEIAGVATLPIDRSMRTMGLRHRATADFTGLPEDARALLQAYAAGVNAWIDSRGRFAAPEFLVLGAPEPWQPADSLLWAKTMGVWLSANWRTELSRLALSSRVPQRLTDELWPPKNDAGRPYAALEAPTSAAEAASRLVAVLPNFPGPYTLPASASNEWAVDGRHTASGKPLLAGDPHLMFGFPGIWYVARIDLPDRVLAGATAPGVPALVIGHNGHIAWTFTTTGADVQDVFIETPAGPGEYQTPDGPKPFVVREERIRVRGEADEVLTVRETRHGPVMSDLNPSGPILAVAMGNLQAGDTAAAGLMALNRARSVAEAGKAAAMITSPVQNLLVADQQTIGLFVTGRIPVRRSGDGSRPVPGDGSHDWIGWASGEALPQVVAPDTGRLVNANERIAPPDFPVFLGRNWFGDWRARRVRALLDASNRHTPAGFARMQTDAVSVFAQQVLPIMLGAVGAPARPAAAQAAQTIDPGVPSSVGLGGAETPARAQHQPMAATERTLLALLGAWDFTAAVDRPEPLIFNAWFRHFYRAVLARNGIPPEHGGPVEDFVAFVLSPEGAHWCGEDRDRLLAQALSEAARGLTARFGDNPAAWRWGEAHTAIFQHPVLRNIPVLGPLTTASVPAPGDDTTVNRGGPNSRFQSVHGAGYRGVYDLSNLDNSLFMVTPGQSGHPLSRNARDMMPRWRDGDTVTLGPTPQMVRATIRIMP